MSNANAHLILPLGTQVVVLTEVRGTDGNIDLDFPRREYDRLLRELKQSPLPETRDRQSCPEWSID